MTGKQVSIEYRSGPQDVNFGVALSLSQTFLRAARGTKGAVYKQDIDGITVTFPRDEFVRLAADGKTFPPDIIDAFERADALMTQNDRERSGFFAKLVDSFRFHDTMTLGYPTLYCPQSVNGMPGRLQVVVKRYGLAEKPQP